MSETFPEGSIEGRTQGEAAPDEPEAELAQEGVQQAFE